MMIYQVIYEEWYNKSHIVKVSTEYSAYLLRKRQNNATVFSQECPIHPHLARWQRVPNRASLAAAFWERSPTLRNLRNYSCMNRFSYSHVFGWNNIIQTRLLWREPFLKIATAAMLSQSMTLPLIKFTNLCKERDWLVKQGHFPPIELAEHAKFDGVVDRFSRQETEKPREYIPLGQFWRARWVRDLDEIPVVWRLRSRLSSYRAPISNNHYFSGGGVV